MLLSGVLPWFQDKRLMIGFHFRNHAMNTIILSRGFLGLSKLLWLYKESINASLELEGTLIEYFFVNAESAALSCYTTSVISVIEKMKVVD